MARRFFSYLHNKTNEWFENRMNIHSTRKETHSISTTKKINQIETKQESIRKKVSISIKVYFLFNVDFGDLF